MVFIVFKPSYVTVPSNVTNAIQCCPLVSFVSMDGPSLPNLIAIKLSWHIGTVPMDRA